MSQASNDKGLNRSFIGIQIQCLPAPEISEQFYDNSKQKLSENPK